MGLYFSISALIIILIFIYIFFSKKNVNNIETKIYQYLIVLTALGLVLDIFSCILYQYGIDYNSFVYVASSKLVFLYFIIWLILFSYYFKSISKSCDNSTNETKKTKIKFIIIFLVAFILIFVLPLDYHVIGEVIVPVGASVFITYGISFVLIIYCLIISIKNRKNIAKNKIKPLYTFILLMIINFAIQSLFPELFLINYLLCLVVIVMYFTIENPDLKMIEELNIARDQAEKANNAKSEFLSNMSHEIRTPLNAIVGFSQALLEEEIPDSAKEEVEDIISASQSLLEIVNGILDISKIEANKLEIVNTEYSFKKVFNELINLTKARMGDKALDFRYTYDETIPDVLYGDHVRIKQIILNLLTNAVKYTKEGYIDFKISSVVKNDICRLIVSVEDSGIGIKNENIDKLFSKFERFDLEQNITIEGTGLGLAITKKLIELMNGKIVVQSVYGKGSRFTVAIDQRIINKKLEDIEQPKQNIDFNNFDYSTKKILIVDDNKINIKVAERLLRDYKVQVDSVLSGFECLDKINIGNTYDLILLDDMMPKMSGVETLKELKKIDGFNTPTVALTANAISGMREKYLNEGFDDYLSKPIDKNELSNILNKYLNN